MHEMGIIMGVMDAVLATARENNAIKVTKVNLRIGEMTEAIEDALQFSFEALSEGTLCEGAQLIIETVHPRSLCFDCGNEFDHDRFHRACPKCESYSTQIISGREMEISSIEIEN